METNYNIDQSDDSLLHLMLDLDIFNTLQSGLESIKNILKAKKVSYNGNAQNLWFTDMAQCLLSTGERRYSFEEIN